MENALTIIRGSVVQRIIAYKTSDGEIIENHAQAVKYQRIIDSDEAIMAWLSHGCSVDKIDHTQVVTVCNAPRSSRTNQNFTN